MPRCAYCGKSITLFQQLKFGKGRTKFCSAEHQNEHLDLQTHALRRLMLHQVGIDGDSAGEPRASVGERREPVIEPASAPAPEAAAAAVAPPRRTEAAAAEQVPSEAFPDAEEISAQEDPGPPHAESLRALIPEPAAAEPDPVPFFESIPETQSASQEQENFAAAFAGSIPITLFPRGVHFDARSQEPRPYKPHPALLPQYRTEPHLEFAERIERRQRPDEATIDAFDAARPQAIDLHADAEIATQISPRLPASAPAACAPVHASAVDCKRSSQTMRHEERRPSVLAVAQPVFLDDAFFQASLPRLGAPLDARLERGLYSGDPVAYSGAHAKSSRHDREFPGPEPLPSASAAEYFEPFSPTRPPGSCKLAASGPVNLALVGKPSAASFRAAPSPNDGLPSASATPRRQLRAGIRLAPLSGSLPFCAPVPIARARARKDSAPPTSAQPAWFEFEKSASIAYPLSAGIVNAAGTREEPPAFIVERMIAQPAAPAPTECIVNVPGRILPLQRGAASQRDGFSSNLPSFRPIPMPIIETASEPAFLFEPLGMQRGSENTGSAHMKAAAGGAAKLRAEVTAW